MTAATAARRRVAWVLGVLAAVGVAWWLRPRVVPPPSPLVVSSSAPLQFRYLGFDGAWDSRDEVDVSVAQSGPPLPGGGLPAAARVVRQQTTQLSGRRPPLTLRMRDVQVRQDPPAADTVLLLPPGLFERDVHLQTGPRGGLNGVDWPSAWTRSGVDEADYDADLCLLVPLLPSSPGDLQNGWRHTHAATSHFLGQRLHWTVTESWHLVSLVEGLANIAWHLDAHTTPTAGGTRSGDGTIWFDVGHGRLQRAEAVVNSQIDWRVGHRQVTWRERRHLEHRPQLGR